MQVLKQRASRSLRRRRRKSPNQLSRWAEAPDARQSFWQRRFYDFNVWSQKKKVEKLHYMHMNPVKPGIVTAKPGPLAIPCKAKCALLTSPFIEPATSKPKAWAARPAAETRKSHGIRKIRRWNPPRVGHPPLTSGYPARGSLPNRGYRLTQATGDANTVDPALHGNRQDRTSAAGSGIGGADRALGQIGRRGTRLRKSSWTGSPTARDRS
jgi:hypothetical protein